MAPIYGQEGECRAFGLYRQVLTWETGCMGDGRRDGRERESESESYRKGGGEREKTDYQKNPLSEKKVKYKTIKIKQKKREHHGSVYTLSAVGRV